jgi:hypothetical protein
MDAGSDEIPRRPLVEVATTGAVLGDRAEGGPPPLFPCSSPSAKSRWAASNKGGEGVGCAGGARRGHDGMGLLHLLLCRLTSSATMCLPHCSYHGSWCPFISGASAWRRAVACPPPPLSRGGGEPSQWSSELPTMALCCGVVVALPCAARERGGRVN